MYVIRRIASLLLSLVLICTAFAGCAPTETATADPSSTAASGTASTPADPSTQTANKNPLPPVELMQLPADIPSIPIDPQNMMAALITGCYEQTITVEDKERTFKVYIPEGAENCDPSVYLIPDSGEDALTFLANSGWKEIADEQKLYLIILEPENGAWNTDGSETAYVDAVVAECSKRTYYVMLVDCFYGVGYGDGSTVMAQAAINKPVTWAGIALFGTPNVTDEFMSNAYSKETNQPHIANGELPLPVWVFTDQADSVQKVVDYWKTANNSSDEYFSNSEADFIYMPSQKYLISETNDQNIAQVRVTTDYDDSQYDADITEKVWLDFLRNTRRHRGWGNNDLRAYTPAEELGAVRKTIEVDGVIREWYEYIPRYVRDNPDVKVPLVISMHGRGGSGDSFLDISEWYKVAEERGFIVVSPTAGSGQQLEGFITSVQHWNKGMDDLKFLDKMIQEVLGTLPIDTSRVYASGQSMGCMMSQMLGCYLPDVITAVGSCSFANMDFINRTSPESFVNEEYQINESLDVPVMLMFGVQDFKGTHPLEDNQSYRGFLEYLHNRYDLVQPLESPATYKVGVYNNMNYYNSKGVPMLRVTSVDYMPHANNAEESWILYDEFFSKFHRNENGEVVYEGGALSD